MKRIIVAAAVACAAGGVLAGMLTVEPGGLTAEEALAKIRTARAGGDAEKWTVRVRGFNVLERTVTLTEADHDIEFAGDGRAAFSGGVRISGWTEEGEGVWSAPAPRNGSGEVAFFDQLWVGSRRAPNARLPNDGYLTVSAATQVVARTDAKGPVYAERAVVTNGALRVLAGIPADELAYAQAGIINAWSYGRRPVGGYDPATGALLTESRERLDGWKVWKPVTTLIELFNVRSAFDAPGEWFLDMKAGRVLYRPLPGEDMASAVVIAPRTGLSALFRVKADSLHRRYSRNVTWRNIRFGFTSATMSGNAPETVFHGQSAQTSDGVIELDGAHNHAFVGCTVSHTGNYAFRFNDGCLSNAVVNCRMSDLGAGGVWMGMRNAPRVPRAIVYPDSPLSTAFNLISNCTITCGGRYNPEGTGVALTHCSDTKVVHNDIHDLYYTGVSVGFVWGFVGSAAQRNEIAWNRIYDLGKHVMSDMGGVYTLSTSFGTTVHHNEIHDVWGLFYGGWALYFDQGSEGIVMRDNVCWNTTDAGFHQHYGTGCVVRNNVFAFNRSVAAVRGDVSEKHGTPCSFHFVNNIVYIDSALMTDRGASDMGGIWANNLWYDVRGIEKARFGGGRTWSDWVASGKETGGAFADPKFVDAAKFDFRLQGDSPALKLGFKPIDLSGVGPTKGGCL